MVTDVMLEYKSILSTLTTA